MHSVTLVYVFQKIVPPLLPGPELATFDHESGALPTSYPGSLPNYNKLRIVKDLREYLNKTQRLRRNTKLFVSWAKLYGPVSRDNSFLFFFSWVKLVRGEAGIYTHSFGSHSTPATSTSAAESRGVALSTSMKAAGRGCERNSCQVLQQMTLNQNLGQMLLDKFVHKQ